MTDPGQREASLEDFAIALDTLHNLGATGLVNLDGHTFNIRSDVEQNRENHPGSYSPYVRILGKNDGLDKDTDVVTREDFYGYVHDHQSSDMASPTAYKNRAGNAWRYNPTFERHERGRYEWSVWSAERHTIVGVDPERVIDFFSPYKSVNDVPIEGLALGPSPVILWFWFAKHLEESKKANALTTGENF